MIIADRKRFEALLNDPETAKDAVIVYLCERLIAAEKMLANVRTAVRVGRKLAPRS
jgi:hypothetical protein